MIAPWFLVRARVGPEALPPDEWGSVLESGHAIYAHEVASPFVLPLATMVTVRYSCADRQDHDMVLDVECPPSIARSAPLRRRSYLAGRACALLALRRAGLPAPESVPIGPNHGPRWPEGVVGSITHTATLASAIVGAARDFRGLGIDCETPLLPAVAEEIAPSVAPEWTVSASGALPPLEDRASAITALFLAKESLYKCVRPLADGFIDFPDAHMTALDLSRHEGRLHLQRAFGASVPRGLELAVRFAQLHEHAHALIAWPQPIDRP